MSTADSKFIKTMNRRILIEKIIEHQSISRSDLAKITGLNKSTVSDQINGLVEQNLISEQEAVTSSGGRKPIYLTINRKAGYSIGIDVDEPSSQIHVTDLLGQAIEVRSIKVELENNTFSQIADILIREIEQIRKAHDQTHSPFGLVGIGIGIHGIVREDQRVVFTPKLQWIDVDIKERFESEFNVPIFVDNNANLCAYAEQVFHYSIEDLFCVSMYSGIGLGIIKDREIYRGFQGFAGEIGHMIVEKEGLPCPCGNKGCWEQYASEKAVMKRLKEKNIIATSEELHVLLSEKCETEVFDQFFDYLAIGLNNIINIFNPETIILNGHLLNHCPQTIALIEKNLHSRMNNYKQIVPSELGKHACSLGGGMIALKEFFGVHRLNLSEYDYVMNESH